MNMNIGKELDAMLDSFQEAEHEGDHKAAETIAVALVQRLIQISDSPVDPLEEFFGDKRSIKSLFGTVDREERAVANG